MIVDSAKEDEMGGAEGEEGGSTWHEIRGLKARKEEGGGSAYLVYGV